MSFIVYKFYNLYKKKSQKCSQHQISCFVCLQEEKKEEKEQEKKEDVKTEEEKKDEVKNEDETKAGKMSDVFTVAQV